MADIKYELWVEDPDGNQELFGSYDDEYEATKAEYNLSDKGARHFRVKILTCPHCGNKFVIGNGSTNECDECGALFNWAGQNLRDPNEWEENDEEDW